MAEQDSTTKPLNDVAKAMDILGSIAGISYHAMVAAEGSAHGPEGMKQLLKEMDSPWVVENFQENAFQAILKLAGEAYHLLLEHS